MKENEHLLSISLREFHQQVFALASESKDDVWQLLTILRAIEQLHRQVREELFEPSLPNNRQKLYQLLKDVDESGGWPYISRMRLQEFFVNYEKIEESLCSKSDHDC